MCTIPVEEIVIHVLYMYVSTYTLLGYRVFPLEIGYDALPV